MKLTIRKKNESWVSLEADSVILKAVSDYFVFKPENYQFTPKYRAKQWDGNIRLYDLVKNCFPLGLLFKLHSWCIKQKIEVIYENFDKSNTIFDDDYIQNYALNNLKLSFPLRDYQLDGVRIGLQERHCILLSPTATGKSAIIYTLLRLILKHNQKYKVLIVVPTIGLVDQMAGDFDDYSANTGKKFSDHCQKIYDGSKKEVTKQIIISTWQSLQNLPHTYFKQFDAILVDECHTGSLKGNVINKIVRWCTRAKYKIGCSGTLQDAKLHEYSLYALYGKVYQLTQTAKEIERGNLSPIQIYQAFLHYPKDDCREFFKQRTKIKKQAILSDKKSGAAIFHHEIGFVNEKEYKRNFIAAICRKQKKNTLILFKRNSQFGYKLYDKFKNEFFDRKIFLITGKTPKEDRNKVREICEKYNDAIIIAGYQIFSTGVNIKNLHNIIFGESTKSKITTLQSIGRGLRKLASKDKMQLFDIVDVLLFKKVYNIMFKHAFARLEMYEKEKHPVKKYDVLAKDYMEKEI
jgi:superfamily II DNA or RNA helicase